MNHVMLSRISIRALGAATMAMIALSAATAAPQAGAAELGFDSDLTWFPGETANARTAELLAESGSRWVRMTVGWHDFEPARGVYDPWSLKAYETEIRRARAAGQRVLLVIQEAPPWATGTQDRHAPPLDPADYARFAAFLATRYGAMVDAYEIWNEPNYARFWTGAPDPAAYARLLRSSYPAIKQADPTARVLFGGPSTNDWRFVEAAYAAGARGFFDVMGAHPYSCRGPDDVRRDATGRMTRDTFLGYRELRATMLAHGDDKPIWFTEFGWSTTTQACGVSEATQARYLERAVELIAGDPYVEVALYYHLRNSPHRRDADEVEGQYGLLRTDFSPKQAYATYVRLARGGAAASTDPAPVPSVSGPTPAVPDPTSPLPAVPGSGGSTVPPPSQQQPAPAAAPKAKRKRQRRTSTRRARAKARARAKSRASAHRAQAARRSRLSRRSRSTQTAITARSAKSGNSRRSPKRATSRRL